MKLLLPWLRVALLPVLVIGGIRLFDRDAASRNYEWPTQMQYSPASASQTASAVLPQRMTQQPPVAGTIPRGFQPFHYGATEEEALRAGGELQNPYPPTEVNLQRGLQVYLNSCSVCHGSTGAGDGPIIPKYPNPPPYGTEKSRSLADGTMFHVITVGRKNMPPHAGLVSAEDRWKAILHIRRLQGK